MELKKIKKYEKKIYKLRTSVQEFVNRDEFSKSYGIEYSNNDYQDRWYQLHHILCAAEYAIQDIRMEKE